MTAGPVLPLANPGQPQTGPQPRPRRPSPGREAEVGKDKLGLLTRRSETTCTRPFAVAPLTASLRRAGAAGCAAACRGSRGHGAAGCQSVGSARPGPAQCRSRSGGGQPDRLVTAVGLATWVRPRPPAGTRRMSRFKFSESVHTFLRSMSCSRGIEPKLCKVKIFQLQSMSHVIIFINKMFVPPTLWSRILVDSIWP